MVNFWGVAQGVAIFGIFTNIINVTVFIRQGIRDSVNISLLGLAISDFLSLFTLFMADICFMPAFQALDLPFVAMHFMYMWAWLHIFLTRVTAWITAYVTLERCLCIAYPLKVKVIITPRRTVIFIVVIYIIMLASVVPVYYSTRADTIFDGKRNRTLQAIALLTDRGDIENVAFVVNSLVPTTAFVIVIICTSVLVRKLRSKAKWRRQSTGPDKSDLMSDRDRRIVKMVVFISAIFIFCYTPGTFVYIWVMLDPEMRIDGQHINLLYTNFSTLFHLEAINSSINIVVYLMMSSKFKSTFLETFCGCLKLQKKKELSHSQKSTQQSQ